MGGCCLLLVVVGDLAWVGVGSSAGHCLMLAMCCGLEMVLYGSDGSALVLFVAENGLGMYCFLWQWLFGDGGVGSKGGVMSGVGVSYCLGCMEALGCWSWVFALVSPWLVQALFVVVVFLGTSERLQALFYLKRLQALFFVVVLNVFSFLPWRNGMWKTPLSCFCGLSLLLLVAFGNKFGEYGNAGLFYMIAGRWSCNAPEMVLQWWVFSAVWWVLM